MPNSNIPGLPTATAITGTEVMEIYQGTTNKQLALSILKTLLNFGNENTIPTTNSTGTDFDYDTNLAWDGSVLTIEDGGDNIFIGAGVGNSTATGQFNTFVGSFMGTNVTSGGENSCFGIGAGQDITEGGANSLYGISAGTNITTGSNNVCYGLNSGVALTTQSNNVFLGPYSGQYETGSDTLFIDNQTRTDEATARTNSLIYGTFNATPSSQLLRINGTFEHTTGNLGFHGSTPVAQQTVTGAKGGNAALTDLLTKLATLGLIVDSTT